MSRQSVATEDAPPPAGPYSQGVIASGRILFLAGQGPFLPNGKPVEGSFAAQAHQTFQNLAAVAAAAGATLAHAVRVGVYLRDMTNFSELNEIYRDYFSEPYPARTTIQSALPGFEIEVDAVLDLD